MGKLIKSYHGYLRTLPFLQIIISVDIVKCNCHPFFELPHTCAVSSIGSLYISIYVIARIPQAALVEYLLIFVSEYYSTKPFVVLIPQRLNQQSV